MTPDMEELPAELGALALRCEQAPGPVAGLRIVDEGHPFGRTCYDADGISVALPGYTRSIDAAMTLVPEEWKLRQMSFSAPCADDRKWHLNLHGGRDGGDTFVGRGATLALALGAAALRVLARMQERSKP